MKSKTLLVKDKRIRIGYPKEIISKIFEKKFC